MLGERLKEIRKSKGLTIKALAEVLSSSPGFISEVENGHKMPGGDFLLSLKRIFDVDLNWLLTGGGKIVASEDSPVYAAIKPVSRRVQSLIDKLTRIIDEGNDKKIKAVEAQLDLLDPGAGTVTRKAPAISAEDKEILAPLKGVIKDVGGHFKRPTGNTSRLDSTGRPAGLPSLKTGIKKTDKSGTVGEKKRG